MFRRLKNWFVGAGLAIGSLFGYQVARPPVIEPEPITQAGPTPSPVLEATPTPEPVANQPTLTLGPISGAYPSEVEMIKKGFEIAYQVLYSDCIVQEFKGEKFTETNGLTNDEILNKLRTTPVSVGVIMFSGSFKENYIWKTMAYEGDGTAIRFNRHFIDTPDEVGSTYLHEIAHNLSFKHYGNKSTSIPYRLNSLFEKCKGKI